MWTKEQIKIINEAIPDFKYFVKNIFALSFDKFVGGEHVDWTANFLQNNSWSMRISAKDHFKSVSLYAHFMWQLLRRREMEAHYFSYQQNMSGYHISKIKQLIARNPFYEPLTDDKPTAENVLKYHWDGSDMHFTLEPHGLLGFKRGIHCPVAYVDDPFQDPASKLLLTIVLKINDIFRTQILDMPREELHVVGTPQTNDDFFFDDKLRKKFAVEVLPVIKSEKEKVVLWPEWKDWGQIREIRDMRGERVFAQEYMCSPAYAEEGFFARQQILGCVDATLVNFPAERKRDTEEDVVGGFDIGKKRHPSHLSVFEVADGMYRQIHQKFMDGWDYTRQLRYLKDVISNFGVDSLYYDSTRGEFESFAEEGRLPEQMSPVNFTAKVKAEMATNFARAVERKGIKLIDDRRMIDQILTVTNDLKAIETPDGHGDSFWSIALCFPKKPAEPRITVFD